MEIRSSFCHHRSICERTPWCRSKRCIFARWFGNDVNGYYVFVNLERTYLYRWPSFCTLFLTRVYLKYHALNTQHSQPNLTGIQATVTWRAGTSNSDVISTSGILLKLVMDIIKSMIVYIQELRAFLKTIVLLCCNCAVLSIIGG